MCPTHTYKCATPKAQVLFKMFTQNVVQGQKLMIIYFVETPVRDPWSKCHPHHDARPFSHSSVSLNDGYFQ